MDSKHKVLIVDDDPQFTRTLSDILRARGYTPLIASEADAALEKVRAAKAIIALIDLRLEGTDGLALLRR
ncbi:MAG: response regulator, partial [Chloroflexi bacterium]|nr:response regulator [Chloroflexota bacterium]